MKNYTIVVALLLCSSGAFGVRNKMPSTKVQLNQLSGLSAENALEASIQDSILITKKHEKYPSVQRRHQDTPALHEAKPKRSRARYNNRMNIRP